MRYRRLGINGPEVSEIGIGTWRHVTTSDLALADRLVNTALDLGINFIDTAESYGTATEALGHVLRAVDRDRYVISTKVPARTTPRSPRQQDDPYAGALTAQRVKRSAENSLRALGTDWIDLLSAHRFDPDTPLEETVGAFGSLAMAGTVAHWGVSEWTATQLAQAVSVADDLGVPRPVANQCQHSVLWRVPEIEVAPVCAKYGIGEVSFWSLAQGVLTGKYPPHAAAPAHSRGASEFGRATMSHVMHDEVLARVELFAELARRRGVSAAQLALAWVLSRPVVSSTVVGVSSVEQLVDNAAASGASFSDKTWLLIDKLFDGCIHEDPAATG